MANPTNRSLARSRRRAGRATAATGVEAVEPGAASVEPGAPAVPPAAASARPRRRIRRRALIGRTITMLALLPLAARLPLHARVIVGLLGDPRVPASRKVLLAGALGYAAAPVDVIPDRFPLVGILDDLVVAALAVDLFFAGVPEAALAEQLEAVGLQRAAFDEDVRRIRRLVPRPLRRIVHRIPAALQVGARVAREADLGGRLGGRLPNVRGLVPKEGSPA